MNKISDGLYKNLPWGLASGGAKEGDVGGARANIAETRKGFMEYMDIVVDFKDQMRRRKDPNNTEVEDTFGEPAPYSLVRRAVVYQEEKVKRAGEINTRTTQVNELLAQMDVLSHGKYNLAALFHRHPPKPPGDQVRRWPTTAILQDMAAAIKATPTRPRRPRPPRSPRSARPRRHPHRPPAAFAALGAAAAGADRS